MVFQRAPLAFCDSTWLLTGKAQTPSRTNLGMFLVRHLSTSSLVALRWWGQVTQCCAIRFSWEMHM